MTPMSAQATAVSSALVYDSLFIRRAPRSQPRFRLFCLPYAGAGASIYTAWADLLPPEIELVAIQLPGREDRVFEQPFTQLDRLVRTLAQAVRIYLDTPFAIFGHSGGALIAFELARELRARLASPPHHLFVSALAPPETVRSAAPIHSGPTPEFKEGLRRLEGTGPEILENDDMMELLLPALRADFQLAETYVYREAEPLACSITALGGAADARVTAADLDGWRGHTSGTFSIRILEGGHFYITESPRAVAETIAAELL